MRSDLVASSCFERRGASTVLKFIKFITLVTLYYFITKGSVNF